ncbi:peroxidase [Daphnia magna]|uniref:peroxidase n=1 Tax=Daphnia magna TaxID=35525 RepID=UPI001E1BA96D|nr:peroxidase [Daphnia magna]XP_045036171.1 peroxidase [Daphnia magna]
MTPSVSVICVILMLLNSLSSANGNSGWSDGGGDVKWRMDCDFPGFDIEKIESPGEQCGTICIANPQCTHFTHASGQCFLKAAPLSTPHISLQPDRNAMCGFVPWKFQPGRDHWNTDKGGLKWLLNCDFFGNDIGQQAGTGEQCGSLCLANPECSHFRFIHGICFIKKAPPSTQRTATNGGMCGFVPWRKSSCPNVGGLESTCRPLVECAVWYDLLLTTPGTSCILSDGKTPGGCCPGLLQNRHNGQYFEQPSYGTNHDLQLESNLQSQLGAAQQASHVLFQSLGTTEKELIDNNIVVMPGSASAAHSLFFHTTHETQKINLESLVDVYTAQELVKRVRLEPNQVASALSRFKIHCPAGPVCSDATRHSPFRTLDGSCNNIQHSTWGKSRTQFQRILLPLYADGVREPRRAKSNNELPSARLVSTSIIRDNNDHVHSSNTYWVTQFGQFIDHDITQNVQSKMDNLTDIECCTPNGQFIDEDLVHPECNPIKIPQNDPFFSKFGRRCMSFVRSAPARRSDCRLGYAEQMNDNTHFLDASQVYGSDEKHAKQLRSTTDKGRLDVTHKWKLPAGHHQMDLLPPDNSVKDPCTLSKAVSGVDRPKHVKCFNAGDPRSNVTPNLAVSHTVLLREHNRIVMVLSGQNMHLNDEQLYQEARRILIAQMQHITYNEWLPIVIGKSKMQQLGLLPLHNGFSRDYDAKVNPSIVNEFAGAAFRFGHSLVQGIHLLFNRERKRADSIRLSQHFFKSQTVYTPGNLDKFLIGLATQPDQQVDNIVTEELTNHLFEEEGKGFGLDLVSINIQRGRDHGIPGYNAYRVLCGLKKAHSFDDLHDHISRQIVDQFKSLYESVDDIDLFMAGISEHPVADALVGPTFQCLIADQFLKLKRGDRYFYDLGGQSGSFTAEQLKEIRKTSLARLVCDNSHVKTIQPSLFKSVSNLNPIVDCDSPSIPRLDLAAWKFGSPQVHGENDRAKWHIGDGDVAWLPDCDFPGGDIGNEMIEGEKCGRLCIDTSGCNAFGHHHGRCWLKTIPSTQGRSAAEGGVCGFLPWKF